MINSFGDINVDLIWKNSSSTDSPDDSRDENLTIQVGGAAVNLARSAVAMGEEARFIGKVGNDPFGRFAIEELSKAGLPTHIVTDPSHPTGIIDLIPTSTLSPTETRLMLHNLPKCGVLFTGISPYAYRETVTWVRNRLHEVLRRFWHELLP